MKKDFELAYFDFEIAFQTLLELSGLFDTWSEDTVEPNFDNDMVKVDWKELNQTYDLNYDQLTEGEKQFKMAQEDIDNILNEVFDGTPPDIFDKGLEDKRDEVTKLVSDLVQGILKGL